MFVVLGVVGRCLQQQAPALYVKCSRLSIVLCRSLEVVSWNYLEFLDLGFVDRGLADEIANEISALHGDLAGIQAKIQAAEALPMTSNGMPQRPDYTAAN